MTITRVHFRSRLHSRLRRGAVALALLLGAAAPPALAQGAPDAPRPQLERQVRERIARIVQARLELTDAQMQKLDATNRKFEQRRRTLFEGERAARRDLRGQLELDDRADQKRVSQLLDQLLSFQDQRLGLVREEQRELAGYLTPVQRARYLALQDQLRRRVEEMRGDRRGGPGRGGPGRGGAGGPPSKR
jgi:Spy/CpxP family protein refolding chaperone